MGRRNSRSQAEPFTGATGYYGCNDLAVGFVELERVQDCFDELSGRVIAKLVRQVQSACNHAERGAARLAGLEPPAHADKEASFDDLKVRIADAISFVKAVDPKTMDGAENREITYPVGQRTETRTCTDYLCNFSLPNFYFHVTTAYAILRHNGLPIGKGDFMGG